MDFVQRIAWAVGGNTPQRSASQSSILKFTQLNPAVQQHLVQVYATLGVCVVVCALGALLGTTFGFVLPLAQLVAFGCMLGITLTRDTPQLRKKRQLMLGTFAFAQGCALTPLVSLASSTYPGVIITALLATAAVFLCFTGSALLTPRRTYLYLGGYLGSAITALAALRLAASVFGTQGLLTMDLMAQLYVGILVFAGYVLYDTQLIVEKAYSGHMDPVQHTLDLLVDALGLFVRLLVLLLRSAAKNDAREQEQRAAARGRGARGRARAE